MGGPTTGRAAQPRANQPLRGPWLMALLVAGAVGLSAVGDEARPRAAIGEPAPGSSALVIAVVLGLVVSAVVAMSVALWRAGRRSRRGDEEQGTPEREPASTAVVVGAVAALTAVAAAVIAAAAHGSLPLVSGARVVTAPPTARPAPHRLDRLLPQPPDVHGWTVLVASVLVVLVAAALVVTRRVTRHRRGTRDAPAAAADLRAPVDEVVTAAQVALRPGSADPRVQVIEAYSAMEDLLRRQVAPPTLGTPRKWLAQVADAWPAARPATATLTDVFERARFSSAPVTRADVASARRCLTQIVEASR